MAARPALQMSLSRLKRWQNQRLAKSHADLLTQRSTAKAASFFLNDLYSDHDLSDRDQAVERVIEKAARILPASAMQVVEKAIALDLLSEQLDQQLAAALLDAGVEQDHLLNEAVYADYFRSIGDKTDRLRQLALVHELGLALSGLVRLPLIGLVLKMSAKPAQKAGVGALHQFVLNGFQAFDSLADPKGFLSLITQRESFFMDRLYQGESAPFSASL